MKLLGKRLIFPLFCLAVGLVVFGASYTMLSQAPGSGPGESDTPGPSDNAGGNDPPTTGAPAPEGTAPEVPGDLTGDEEVEPVRSVEPIHKLMRSLTGDATTATQLLNDEAVALDVIVPTVDGAPNSHGTPLISHVVILSRTDDPACQGLRLLLEAGANPNMAGNYGFTPLHFAVLSDNVVAVKLLLKYGANHEQPNYDGVTPLQLAQWSNSVNSIQAIESFRRGAM